MSQSEIVGLFGILVGLSVLIWFAFRSWSVLLLAPNAALTAAFFSRNPLLAHRQADGGFRIRFVGERFGDGAPRPANEIASDAQFA